MSDSPLYEGKAKRLWKTDTEGQLRMEFKDDATAFDGAKKAQFASKGKLNAAISLLIYGLLEQEGIETHLIKEVDETNHLVHAVDVLQVEGDCAQCGCGFIFAPLWGGGRERILRFRRFEFSLKNDDLGDPMLNDEHVVVLDLATQEELDYLRESARKVNDIMRKFFGEVGAEAGGL